jgi:hypothetical protein
MSPKIDYYANNSIAINSFCEQILIVYPNNQFDYKQIAGYALHE